MNGYYVYPREMRATRDLLRRRTFLMRRRSELLTYGVIAPDPSLDITETPTSGMNSPLCLDGV